jgi:hypothetical protein
MYVLTLTLAAGANQVVAKSPNGIDTIAQFQSVTFQNNNATNAVYIGDAKVTSLNGYKLASGAAIIFTCPLGYGEDLKSWFVAPTAANDKVTVLVVP